MQGAGECVRRRLLPLTHPPPAYGKCLFRSSALLLLREITSELFKTDEIRHVENNNDEERQGYAALVCIIENNNDEEGQRYAALECIVKLQNCAVS